MGDIINTVEVWKDDLHYKQGRLHDYKEMGDLEKVIELKASISQLKQCIDDILQAV